MHLKAEGMACVRTWSLPPQEAGEPAVLFRAEQCIRMQKKKAAQPHQVTVRLQSSSPTGANADTPREVLWLDLPTGLCLQLPLTTECKQVGNLSFLSVRASPSNSRRTKLAGFLSVLLLPIGYWLSLMSPIDFTVRLLGNNRRSLSAASETQHGGGSYLESYLCSHKGWLFLLLLIVQTKGYILQKLVILRATSFPSRIRKSFHLPPVSRWVSKALTELYSQLQEKEGVVMWQDSLRYLWVWCI